MVHLNIKVGEYAIILNTKREFLLLQFKESNQYKWHFPGGRLDEGDESVVGLLREIKEETHLEVTDIAPVYTKIFHPEDPKYGVFFLAHVKEPYEVQISDEHHSYKWFSKEDLDSIDFWQPFYKSMLEELL